MAAVYKYPLPILDRTVVLLPRYADILHIGEQDGGLFLWALVDPDRESVPRAFRIFGTGHLIDVAMRAELEHRTTVVCANGLVWHVFEEV